MNNIFRAIALITCMALTIVAHAQDKEDTKRRGGTSINLGKRGFRVEHTQTWTHTNPTWKENSSKYAMTRIDSNDYVYTIPNLRSHYGVRADSHIQKIAVIFKDSLGEIKTSSIFIAVVAPDALRKMTPEQERNWHYTPPGISTLPAHIPDSTESVTIHFHPYDNKNGGKELRGYKGTIFIYSGVITRSVNDTTNEEEKEKKEGDFDAHIGVLDIGTNFIMDNTDYNSAAVKSFLNVPANRQNGHLLDLRQSKSINVNIYPFMETFYALKRKNQRINITTGIGLQLYNFRYENPVTFTKNPNSVILDTLSFKKDKLGIDYLNVPLMINFKTRLHKDKWLVYGVGITAGYNIATWTKQVVGGKKMKLHDDFGISGFNSCVTAEIGISTGVRFYGTYQLTNLFDASTGMEQHPISVGLRFFPI